MKTTKMVTILVLGLGLMVWLVWPVEAAPMGTPFTYQGRLMDANGPANGIYDFLFKLFNEPNGTGYQIPLTNDVNDIDVIDGYFTVELDFGSDVFDGDARWLEILVRPGDSIDVSDYVTLSPRQEVTPTPYALYTENAGTDNDWMISGNDMYSIPSGNVGIRTNTPESRLHIEQSVGAWGEGIRLSYGDHEWDIVTDYGGERLTIAPDQNSTEGLVIRNGHIGIGTTSPGSKLDVDGSSSNPIISVANNYDEGPPVREYGTAVYGESIQGYGVYGYTSGAGIGVFGKHNTSDNFGYLADAVYGVHGCSNSGRGVFGHSNSGDGVYGESGTGIGVYGQSAIGYAGYFNGDVYVTTTMSAGTVVDRTPYPKDLATAYEAIMSMERLSEGQYDENNKEVQLDHSMLSDFVSSKDGNRDLSATVSCHNEVLKDLILKQEGLSKAHIYIEQLQKQNQILEARLVKLEAMVAQSAGR